ncbi:hypothetical protein BD414DRAFT_243805 [Trametes punicea]|nr:hypothetical protein BD414DRAFT_243805 [Trametes punicea]
MRAMRLHSTRSTIGAVRRPFQLHQPSPRWRSPTNAYGPGHPSLQTGVVEPVFARHRALSSL